MRLSFLVAFLSALSLAAQDSTRSPYWRNWFESGVEALKNASYREAVDDFQKSVSLKPNEVEPHLYLASAWMSLYISGDQSSDNLDKVRNAEKELNTVLKLDPENLTALQSLAHLSFRGAQEIVDEDQKLRRLETAASWYHRVLAVGA